MSYHPQIISTQPDNKPPPAYSFRMGSRDRFIPLNMREGRPARLIHSATVLCNWAKSNVLDIDSFLAFESAYSLIADDLNDVFSPHNTIVAIFYTSFRKKELSQFKWFTRGVQFPRTFSHPVAHRARHEAALGIFPQLVDDDLHLQEVLLFRQADEVGMQIGINFLQIPARRIEYHGMEDYVTNFTARENDLDYASKRESPPPPQIPPTPHLPTHDDLPKPNSDVIDTRPAHLPPALLTLLHAIHTHRAPAQPGESLSPANDPRNVPTSSNRARSPLFLDSSPDTIYGDLVNDPMGPEPYNW
jgi:hypothetical protein